jgi:general nucleoside transport system permease protein
MTNDNQPMVEATENAGFQWRRIMPSLVFGLTILAVLIVTSIIIILVGGNPIEAYKALVIGAFGSKRAITETILQATPLLIIAIGLVLAFRSKMWNIGAEGQYMIGALCGTWVALTWGDNLPAVVIIPLMFIAGAIGGGLWGAIPGILKAKRGLSEIVVSLMLNFVAFYIVAFLSRGPMKDPEYFLPKTASLPEAAILPYLGDTRIHIGVLVAIAVSVIGYVILWRTTLGYELRAVGANAPAAEAAGINVPRSMITVMVLSGMFAGLAGIVEVAGVHHHLSQEIAIRYGYTAILVAILGQLNPFGVLAAAFFFASLQIGADYMHRVVNLQKALVGFIQATLVLFYLAGAELSKRLGR